MKLAPKLTPCLWFDGQALAAARFYTSAFPESRMLNVTEIPSGPAEGSVLVAFEIGNQRFDAFDSARDFSFTQALSFMIPCDSQDEIDYYWEKLSENGKKQQCGWVEDQFGLSWQIIPANLRSIMQGNPGAVMATLLTMHKIDIGTLQEASQSS
ncbi:MAG: VOC family protein [Anaerolineaceae bacterium]|nr:VOC family protein [Anaerolineaceae bacterium]MCY4022395.1 VOC family protein [Anaerolineaceae bacterium]